MDDPSDSNNDPTLQLKRSQLQYAMAKMAAERAEVKTQQLAEGSEGLISPPAVSYPDRTLHVLPLGYSNISPSWMITLHVGDEQAEVIRVHVRGDVVLGIKRPRQQVPDLDLTDFQAEEKGVSRRHAVLRPNTDALYLIPLQSTNGTRINGTLINTGSVVALNDGDVISLGALHLGLKIVSPPQT